MKQVVVFDIETDGLDPTLIHVLSAHIDGKIVSYTGYDEMRKFFSDNAGNMYPCGHNIERYDIPAIKKILGIDIGDMLIDTLALSWYLYPKRTRHGLDVWGEDLGIKKKRVEDWVGLSKDIYIERCETDVAINVLLWNKQLKTLLELYESEEKMLPFLKYLGFKMNCAAEQERSRWKLDVKKAEKGFDKLEKIKEEKVEQIGKALPRVDIITKRSRPKKPFKQDGKQSAVGEKWFKLLGERQLPEDYLGVVEVVSGTKEANPNSNSQIKDWLYSFGWKPETFKFVRNKETGEVKQIPQINLPKGEGICPSIKKLYKKEPLFELLDGLSVVSHRMTVLKGLLKSVSEDGYVKAEVQGLTNTLRFKHAVCVNLPGVEKPYGELIRGCLMAPEGYELCGSDMASLEDRTKQHYMWPHDPAYVRDMMVDDFDPHLDLAVIAGALTYEQVAEHKTGIKKQKTVRAIYKEVNYACVYGAGGPTISRAAGVTLKEAKKLVAVYWERNWSVRVIPKEIRTKKVGDGSMWLQNPVSQFWYSLRAEKDIFSTLNQGTGVYCFDTWISFVRSKRPQLTGQFHDEIILTIKEGKREECKTLLKWAIQKTNEVLKLNRDLDVDVQFGKDYSKIH